MASLSSLKMRRPTRATWIAAALSVLLSVVSFQVVKSADAPAGKPVAPPDDGTAATATLPNGATASTETYGDWIVACNVQNGSQRCAAQHTQANPQNQQTVLALELTPAGDKGDRIEGTAVLPFGLALASGLAFQVDDRPNTSTFSFRTCMPGGCLVTLTFDARTTSEFRSGTTLKAKVAADGGTDLIIPISLNGFAAALDRAAALRKDVRKK